MLAGHFSRFFGANPGLLHFSAHSHHPWPDATEAAHAQYWRDSATLGEEVAPRTCVQAASNSVWYQCNGQSWVKPVDAATGSGPIGACSTMHAL